MRFLLYIGGAKIRIIFLFGKFSGNRHFDCLHDCLTIVISTILLTVISTKAAGRTERSVREKNPYRTNEKEITMTATRME